MRVNVTREGELRPGLVIVRKEYSPYGITKLAAAEPSILNLKTLVCRPGSVRVLQAQRLNSVE